jgi:ABC-type transporter Mla subunit MlaD
MGFKLSIILSVLLVSAVLGSGLYINYLHDQISQLKANAIVLETEIQAQNKDIEKLVADAKATQNKVNELTKKNQESVREVNRLRQTFANHDMNDLALNKPTLIQNKVNKATLRVKNTLIELTNPDQFDEESINPSD